MTETEQAARDVEEVVRRYFAVTDELRSHESPNIRRLRTVTTDREYMLQRDLIRRGVRNGHRQVGNLQVVELTVDSVALQSDPPVAHVSVCWDVSDADIVDARGDSIVSPDRPDSGWTRFTVLNKKWDSNPQDGWRISMGLDMEKEPCAG